MVCGSDPQKKDGSIRNTVCYRHYTRGELNAISSLGQLPIARVDEILDALGKGRIFSMFDLVSPFHQITIDRNTVNPHRVLHARPALQVAGHMPRGSSASPGWFVKVINEVTTYRP